MSFRNFSCACNKHICIADNSFYYWSIPRRYRYKPKWAVNLKKDTNQQLALGNFDAFYKPYFGNDWPSIRLSLLSNPKHCAVVNKYGSETKEKHQLKKLNLVNFVEKARSLYEVIGLLDSNTIKDGANNLAPSFAVDSQSENVDAANSSVSENDSEQIAMSDLDESIHKDNLNVYVPTEQVYTEKELLLKEEINLNSFQAEDIGVKIITPENVNIPKIKALVFPAKNVSSFPHPKSKFGICGYYLMDAASILPVIALDVQPTDTVLDLCAAPGGKTYVILQSLDVLNGGRLLCNDSSISRLNRLKTVLYSHFPPDVADQVTLTQNNGIETHSPEYNKVLVDVPCNGDRYAVSEEDNNLFQICRTGERLRLMKTQKQLLLSAIKSCAVGGSIVYSTCTLSPAQNDGVIQAVMEDLWRTSKIEVAVVDLTPLTSLFSETFKFHTNTRYGKLVLPNLVNNFGPTYFAKLKRMK